MNATNLVNETRMRLKMRRICRESISHLHHRGLRL
jgi:hypothetical protein